MKSFGSIWANANFLVDRSKLNSFVASNENLLSQLKSLFQFEFFVSSTKHFFFQLAKFFVHIQTRIWLHETFSSLCKKK